MTTFLCIFPLTIIAYCPSYENSLYLEGSVIEYYKNPEEYLSRRFFQIENSSLPGYEESTWKRGKIIFFISIPFIVLAYSVAIATTHYAAVQEASFSSLSAEPFLFAGLSSLTIVGGIIYLDIKKRKHGYEEDQLHFSIARTKAL